MYSLGTPLTVPGGADIAITYTSVDASPYAAQLTSDHGITAKAFRCEVSSSAEVDGMLGEVEAAFGRKVDIGIANAGVSLWKDSHDNTDGELPRSEAERRSAGAWRGVMCVATATAAMTMGKVKATAT